jgi:hypothetical protein
MPSNGGSVNKALFNTSDTAIAYMAGGDYISDYSSNNLAVYAWSNATGFGTKFANPTLPSSTEWANETGFQDISFSSTEQHAFVLRHIDGMKVWDFDPATGFGSAYAAPATAPPWNAKFAVFTTTL